MKIAIANSTASFLDFYINLARYLVRQKNEVVFINPDRFVANQLKKNKIKFLKYPSAPTIDYYKNKSDLIINYLSLFKIKSKKKLIEIKDKEYSNALSFFEKKSFDYVLIFNGALNVESDVCRELSLKTFFFEQGYFPNTMQMDFVGVNCNTGYTNLTTKEFIKFFYQKRKKENNENYEIISVEYSKISQYFYRFFELEYRKYFYRFLIRNIKQKKAKKRFSKYNFEKVDFQKIGKYIFFPLQVNTDTQIVLNSIYCSMYDAVNDVLPDLLRTGLKIVIKEHPFEVEPVDYSELLKHEQVILLKKANIEKLIENAEFVVNVNSSVGLQAVEKYKKVLLLGDSFYKNSPLSIKYSKIKGKDIFRELNKIEINKEQIDNYISHFKKEIFINGHMQNLSMKLFEDISSRLI